MDVIPLQPRYQRPDAVLSQIIPLHVPAHKAIEEFIPDGLCLELAKDQPEHEEAAIKDPAACTDTGDGEAVDSHLPDQILPTDLVAAKVREQVEEPAQKDGNGRYHYP